MLYHTGNEPDPSRVPHKAGRDGSSAPRMTRPATADFCSTPRLATSSLGRES